MSNHDTFPNNLEAERNVIGSLLVDNASAYRVIDSLKPSHFYDLNNKIIYETFLEIYLKGKEVDLVVLTSRLNEKKTGISVSYVASLMNEVYTASLIQQYADIIVEKSIRRDILKASYENSTGARDEERDVVSILAEVQNRVFAIGPESKNNSDIASVLGEIHAVQEEYAEKYRQGKKLLGHSCGIDLLDKYTDGVRRGQLWAIGAWHGTGKTSFALNILHELMKQEIPVAFISLEMTSVDIAAKIMGIRHGVSAMKILKGKHDATLQEKVKEGEEFLRHSKLAIFHEYDVEKIKMLIRKDVYTRKTEVFVLDYMQKLTHEKMYDETPLMSYAAKTLANLAQELNVTIILLSQISNAAHKGDGAGAGFKGTGAIEASADLAIKLERDKKAELPDAQVVPVNIVVTKNKFGLDGAIPYHIHLKSGAFNGGLRIESKV